ncbi:MAG: T9SS type A sorting domain-containing protein, partial [Phaeodactylibacter sp.]|nr:T9SS type A sorting domain-containing protein [Phaeodactylibacter sp.]
GANGNGNGTVNYSVASNSGASARTGTISVAGLVFTVNQSACNISISPASASFQAAGGTGSVNVSAQPDCSWSAQSNVGWITITSGASGNGNGMVNFSVEMNNSTAPRTGAISIVGVAFSVTQAGIITGSEEVGPTAAGKFELWQNFPNPFSGETTIRYHLPVSARVTLEIFDPWGGRAQALVDEQQNAGLHTVVWNGQDAAPGMYIYRIVAGGFMKAKKMLLLR